MNSPLRLLTCTTVLVIFVYIHGFIIFIFLFDEPISSHFAPFQATLHKQILHMAGQLGLDPPTMSLCSGGPAAELEQALQNSEAVAKCFHCSISTSAILFIIYCSAYISLSEKISIQDKLDTFLKQMKVLNLRSENKSEVLDPIVLYVLVPDLPKR